MFQKITQLIARTIPQPLDVGVLHDALDPVRPHCVAQDLSKPVLGGWVVVVMSAQGEAGRHPSAYTMLDEGELIYDRLLMGLLANEFTNRGLSVSYQELKPILANASGSASYVTDMAVDCFKLEQARKAAK